MVQLTSQILDVSEPGLKGISAERQRFKRVKISILGRFMRENRLEYPCETIDASPGAIAIKTYEPVFPGEQIVLYLDQLGRMNCNVVRIFDGGCAVEIKSDRAKREKVAEVLTWLINHEELGIEDTRRHDRLVPQIGHADLTLPNGRIVRAQLLDISVSGASISMANKLPVGSEIALGGIPARVVRHHEGGFGIEFYKIQNSAALKRYFG